MKGSRSKSRANTGKRASHSHKKRKHREQLRKMYRKYKSIGRNEDIRTEFEPCDAPSRPAVAPASQYKLKWKNGARPEQTEDEKADFEDIQKTKNFQIARKLMIQLRCNNILETMVKEKDLPAVKKFFKEDLESPPMEVIGIIDEAMEFCYGKIAFHQDQYNIVIDSEMREFLLNKEKVGLVASKAKQCLLDVILICPEFMPLMWGGESVGLPSVEDDSNPPSSDGSKEFVSPWQKVVNKARDGNESAANASVAKNHLKSGIVTVKSSEKSSSDEKSGDDSKERRRGMKWSRIFFMKDKKSKEKLEKESDTGSMEKKQAVNKSGGLDTIMKKPTSNNNSKITSSINKIEKSSSDEKMVSSKKARAQKGLKKSEAAARKDALKEMESSDEKLEIQKSEMKKSKLQSAEKFHLCMN
ncbi:hypothetical protein GCK32_011709 [Trichostrongylus colubriformis]|uniref:DUF7774 domain-containing protein n=1 Tax=Trichostrongylus colubriformis TaxID=6319 RepID=A0AAN8ETN7_TRICO